MKRMIARRTSDGEMFEIYQAETNEDRAEIERMILEGDSQENPPMPMSTPGQQPETMERALGGGTGGALDRVLADAFDGTKTEGES